MKKDEKWLANYDGLKTYIEEHHHLPPKNAPLGRVFKIQKKSRTIFDQINAVTH